MGAGGLQREQARAQEQVRGRAEGDRPSPPPPAASKASAPAGGRSGRTPSASRPGRSGRRRPGSPRPRGAAWPCRRSRGCSPTMVCIHSVGCSASTSPAMVSCSSPAAYREARGDHVAQASLAVPGGDQALHVGPAALDRVGHGQAGRCGPSATCRRSPACLRFKAEANNASTETLRTEPNTRALVVPLRSSSSTKNSAVSSAWPLSAKAASAGKVWRSSRVQQLLAVGGDDVDLREVDVGVDEAGNDQLAAQVLRSVSPSSSASLA